MKIWFFSHYFFPEGNAPATRVHQLCRRWAEAGHDVTVITGVPNVPAGVVYDGYQNRVRLQVETIDRVRILRVWTYIAANQRLVRRVLNYASFMCSAVLVAMFRPRPDVIIATSPQFFCGWAGAIAAWLKRRPFVLEVRDLWPESIVAVGAMKRGALLRSLEWLERRLYRAATHIVAVGEGYRRGLLERGVESTRITLIPNGVDANLYQPRAPDGEIRSNYGLGGKLVCSYVGTIGMASGLDVVLRAARLLADSEDSRFAFLLVGDGADREKLERRVAEAGLAGIHFAGRQPKSQIPGFLSATDVCLVHLRKKPLFRDVLPSKIFEALAMEKPVLLGVEGEAAALVERSGGGLCFEPENERELVAGLRRFADEPDLGVSLGRAGRAYALEHFDRDRQARDYALLLQRFVAGDTTGGRR